MRRNRSTPFEVMGQATRSAGASAATPATEPVRPAVASDGQGRVASRWAAASDWWASLGAGTPVVLRVPRGLAVVLVVALVGLLMLSYWVGHSRGTAAGGAEVAERETVTDEPAVRQPPPRRDGTTGGPAVAGRADTAAPSTASADGGTTRASTVASGTPLDPREPGQNYFVLAFYPPEAAEGLAKWLSEEHGVATVLESVQNRRELEVIAVDRGFHRDELSSGERREYERELRAIGRAWQRHNRGRGDALESMYPKRYNGP